MSRTYTIGQLAAEAGVNVETVRYYQRRKLMPEPARPAGGTRRYDETDAERLRFIKRAQLMGFALVDVESLLSLRARRSCQKARDLAASKLDLVDSQIRELRRLRKELSQLVATCDRNVDEATCPIIERLTSTA